MDDGEGGAGQAPGARGGPTYFYRVLHWTERDERVNLALYVYDETGACAWRQLTEWERAAAFANWPADDLQAAVASLRAEIAGWSLLAKHSRWRHLASTLQIDPPRVRFDRRATREEVADDLAHTLLVGWQSEGSDA